MEEIGLSAIFDTTNFNRGLDQYLGGINEANGATQRAEASSFSFARALEVTVGGALLEVGKLFLDVAGDIAQFGVDSIGVATDFESSLAILQTAAASTGMSIDELGGIAIAVGADSRILGASASGAAEAMTGLFRSGLGVDAVFGDLNAFMHEGAELGGALAASFNLAAASELDVAQASDLATMVLATFGGQLETGAEQSEFLASAFNNIIQTANASISEVPDLVEALSYVGPSARDAGMSIEDTNNALALFSMGGVTGSRAGTMLEAVLRDLTKTTPEATAMLDELQVEVYDTETGAMRPFIDTLGDLELALADATDAERDAALGAIFTAQGRRGINTLLGQGTEGWNDMADEVSRASTLEEQAATRSQTFAAQMEVLDGQIETLQIQIGSALLPVLTTMIEGFIIFAEKYGPQVAEAFEDIVNFISPLVQWFAVAVLEGDSLNDFLTQIPKPIMDFGNSIKTFLMPILENFEKFFKNMEPAIEDAINALESIFNAFSSNAGVIWESIQDVINGAIQIILGYFTFITNILSGNWDEAWEGIKMAVQGIMDLIPGIIEAGFAIIASLMGQNLEDLKETASGLWEQIKTITGLVWERIVEVLSTTWELIKTVFSTAFENISNLVTTGSELVKTIFTTVWTSIYEFISFVWETIKNAFIIALGFIAALISGDTETAKQIIIAAWERVKEFLGETLENIKEIITTVFTNIVETATEKFETVKTIAGEKWEAIKELIKEKVESLKQLLPQIWEDIKSLLAGKYDDLNDSASTKFQDILKTIQDKIEEVKQFLSDVDLAQIGTDIITGLADGISNAAGIIQDAISNTINGAIDSAKGLLGIQSPSKLFAEMGLDIDAGLAQGIAQGQSIPEQAMQGMIGNFAQLAGSTTNISNTRQVNVQMNPTYTNVQSESSVYYDTLAALQAVGA